MNKALWTYENLRDRLKELGCSVSDCRVPFTYHHDMARQFASERFGIHPSRVDVGCEVSRACGENAELHEAQLFLGCLAYHLKWAPVEAQFAMIEAEDLREQAKLRMDILNKNDKTLFWFIRKDMPVNE